MVSVSRKHQNYAIQLITLFGTDSWLPFSISQFLSNQDDTVTDIRKWYYENCDGYTFKAMPSIAYTSNLTENAFKAITNSDIQQTMQWTFAQMDVAGLINIGQYPRIYCFGSPAGVYGPGGMQATSTYFPTLTHHPMADVSFGAGKSTRYLGGVEATMAVANPPSNPTNGTSFTVKSGMAKRFDPRVPPFKIRIWDAYPAQSGDAGYEIARVDSISGDTLTITRGSFGTSTRAIGTDDQIWNEDDQEWFANTLKEWRGSLAHELGHCFGTHYFNPAECAGMPFSPPFVPVTATNTNLPQFNRTDGQGFYWALPHPQWVWDVPNNASQSYPVIPYSGATTIMQDWWNYRGGDFGDTPSFFAYEKVLLKQSPWLTFRSSSPTSLND